MELTVKEMAARERVDERTVRRWIAKGAVSVRRTPGGGIRVLPDGSGSGSRAVMIPSPMASSDTSGQSST